MLYKGGTEMGLRCRPDPRKNPDNPRPEGQCLQGGGRRNPQAVRRTLRKISQSETRSSERVSTFLYVFRLGTASVLFQYLAFCDILDVKKAWNCRFTEKNTYGICNISQERLKYGNCNCLLMSRAVAINKFVIFVNIFATNNLLNSASYFTFLRLKSAKITPYFFKNC
jgi:hypothetical protein